MKDNLAGMLCLDLYFSNRSLKKNIAMPHEISPSTSSLIPLLSWDIFSLNYAESLQKIKSITDIQTVKAFARQKKWKNSIDAIFENQDFEAIILTDVNQKIIWVNDGFTQMTGFSKTHALNKTPRFLQGAKTSSKTSESIRNKLKGLEPFTEVIINYKKDNSTYKCEVRIIPLYNTNVTHFLAIEKQVI